MVFKVNGKVGDSELMRIPFTIVIGDKEEKGGVLAVRERDGKVRFWVKMEKLIEEIKQ